MAAPFNSDDLVQRSFVSSIIGLGTRGTKTRVQRQSNFALPTYPHQEPCCSYKYQHIPIEPEIAHEPAIFDNVQTPHFVPLLSATDSQGSILHGTNLSSDFYFYPEEDTNRRLISKEITTLLPPMRAGELSQADLVCNLSLSPLRVASDELPTHEDIYQEILTECRNLESSERNSLVQQIPNMKDQPSANPATDRNEFWFSKDNFQQKVQYIMDQGIVSIEEFVKTLVNMVKDAGNMGKENPSEILEKKRKQNNKAAARYRERQKEAHRQTKEEIKILEKKNCALKQELNIVQKEIDYFKVQL